MCIVGGLKSLSESGTDRAVVDRVLGAADFTAPVQQAINLIPRHYLYSL
jgi:hypothetical protein